MGRPMCHHSVRSLPADQQRAGHGFRLGPVGRLVAWLGRRLFGTPIWHHHRRGGRAAQQQQVRAGHRRRGLRLQRMGILIRNIHFLLRKLLNFHIYRENSDFLLNRENYVSHSSY